MATKKPLWREMLEIILGAILISSVSRGAIAETRMIPSSSMEPTLQIEDRLVVEKLSFHLRDISRGDVLVFHPVDEELDDHWWHQTRRWLSLDLQTPLIKRVVGLPGETISVHQGRVFIDGQPLQEAYIKQAPLYEMSPFLIPEDHLFMMGDNRNNSADSHVWGPLPADHVKGRAIWRFWPPARTGWIQ